MENDSLVSLQIANSHELEKSGYIFLGRMAPPQNLRDLPQLYALAALGRLVPYLERPCLRSLTPAVSSVPRMM
jgi:hypothetical protein